MCCLLEARVNSTSVARPLAPRVHNGLVVVAIDLKAIRTLKHANVGIALVFAIDRVALGILEFGLVCAGLVFGEPCVGLLSALALGAGGSRQTYY